MLADFLGALLILSSSSKIASLPAFAVVVRSYQLLPRRLVSIAAYAIPTLELIVGIILVLRYRLEWAAYLAGVLFATFGLAVSVNLLRGRRNLACGCFGFQQDHLISWKIVLRNTILAVGSCALAFPADISPATFGVEGYAFGSRLLVFSVGACGVVGWVLAEALVMLRSLQDLGEGCGGCGRGRTGS
jgi:hypothetical protein